MPTDRKSLGKALLVTGSIAFAAIFLIPSLVVLLLAIACYSLGVKLRYAEELDQFFTPPSIAPLDRESDGLRTGYWIGLAKVGPY